MRVLIAPDKLKHSLSARAAANAIAEGAERASELVRVDRCPLADGGEGTLEALLDSAGGELVSETVSGPLGAPVEAEWALLADGATAVIESARAAGLALIGERERDPLRATSFGVGELVQRAIDRGARRIIVGLGGSATSDGGAGMAQALGVRFDGAPQPIRAIDLGSVSAIDRSGIDPRLASIETIAASDVDSPLLGERGAARMFAPQKGASPADVEALERALAHLAALCSGADPEEPGAGAAGGLGFGLRALLGARIASGAEIVLDACRFDARLADADLLVTGEGRLDAQSLRGKAAIAAARRAARRDVPAVALVGECTLSADEVRAHGLVASFSIVRGPTSRELALENAQELLADLAERVVALSIALSRA